MISRRQFFRRFWNTDKSSAQRVSRYEVLENYVRTSLLPYDFALSEEQEKELFTTVRSILEESSDQELFSVLIRGRLEDAVATKIQPWSEESKKRFQEERLREIRESAADYVNAFLSLHATPEAIGHLKDRFQVASVQELEAELKEMIRSWIESVEDEQLLNYDVFTVKDLVFAQLGSWC